MLSPPKLYEVLNGSAWIRYDSISCDEDIGRLDVGQCTDRDGAFKGIFTPESENQVIEFTLWP